MNLVRKLKLSKLLKINLSENELKIISYIKDILDNLICYNIKFEKDRKIYFNSKNEYIIEICDNNLWISNNFFNNIFYIYNNHKVEEENLSTDIKNIIKYLAEKKLNIKFPYSINIIQQRYHQLIINDFQNRRSYFEIEK